LKQLADISTIIPKGSVDNNLVKQFITSTSKDRDTLFGIEVHQDEDTMFHFGFGYVLEQMNLEDDFDNDQTTIRFQPEGEIYKDKVICLSYINDGDQITFPLSEELLRILCFNETITTEVNKEYLNIIHFLFDQPLFDISLRQSEPKIKAIVKEWSKNSKFKNIIGPEFGFKTVYSSRYEPKSESVLKSLDTSKQIKKQRDSRKLQLEVKDTLSKENFNKPLSSSEKDELKRLQSTTKKKKAPSSSKSGKGIDSKELINRAELIKASQLAGNTAGTPELKRILNNLVKHKLMPKEVAKTIAS
jgi:hypothetical protein